MQHIRLLVLLISSILSSAVWACDINRVDKILIQIDRLSAEEQTVLIKRLIAKKTDQAIVDTKEKVEEIKQNIQEKINDPAIQEPLNKAKEKLKKLYEFFQEEDETASPTTI